MKQICLKNDIEYVIYHGTANSAREHIASAPLHNSSMAAWLSHIQVIISYE